MLAGGAARSSAPAKAERATGSRYHSEIGVNPIRFRESSIHKLRVVGEVVIRPEKSGSDVEDVLEWNITRFLDKR